MGYAGRAPGMGEVALRFAVGAFLTSAAVACSDGDTATSGAGGSTGALSNGPGPSGPGAGGSTSATGGNGTGGSVGISEKYPGDVGIGDDPSVIFHSDFESGLDGWTSHTNNPDHIDVLDETGLANGGSRYLRAQVTKTQLAQNQYISAQAQYVFTNRVPQMYWRFYTRFVGATATPHHWVRVGAADDTYASDGLANTVPPGDRGFWFDLDASREQTFSFYAYWYKMRSGRCNDGTANPGCEGDQGTTYYYGNSFDPANQTPFERDQWFCVEIMAKANTVGQSDGEVALWVDNRLVGEYKPGAPRGRWLRDTFFSWGEYFIDEQAFEGFDFRSSEDVAFKRVTLDAYYQADTIDPAAPEAQIILYDDVVVAESRIGCKAE